MDTERHVPTRYRPLVGTMLCWVLASSALLAAPLQVIRASGPAGTIQAASANFAFVCAHGEAANEVVPGDADYRWYVKDTGTGGDFVEARQGMTYPATTLEDGTYTVKAECTLNDVPGDPDNGISAHVATHTWDFAISAAAGAPSLYKFRQEFEMGIADWEGNPTFQDMSKFDGVLTSWHWEVRNGDLADVVGYRVREVVPSVHRPTPPWKTSPTAILVHRDWDNPLLIPNHDPDGDPTPIWWHHIQVSTISIPLCIMSSATHGEHYL